MMKYTFFKYAGLLIVCILVSHNVVAQNDRSDNKWHLKLEPYFMLSYMDGKTGSGLLPDVKFEQKAKDILDNLKMGGMLYGEVYKGPWTLSSDFIYMKLGSDIVGQKEILKGDVEVTQLNWEAAALYRVTPWLDAGVGVQLNSLKSKTDLEVSTENVNMPLSGESSEVWLDPSIIARVSLPLDDAQKWSFSLKGNIGGFGIGSDFYWQVQPQFGYQFSRLFQLSAGYRAVSVDYKSGKDKDRFLYDVLTHGPYVKFGFSVF